MININDFILQLIIYICLINNYHLLICIFNTIVIITIIIKGGNLLAPHDSIIFQFGGQRFNSKTIIQATIFFVHFPARFSKIYIGLYI